VISSFVSTHLSTFLTEDPEWKCSVPKVMVANLYYRWCSLKGHTIQVERKIVRMQITNELKKLFPALLFSEDYYRGIAFKKGIMDTTAG
jgi:hypothetical protein